MQINTNSAYQANFTSVQNKSKTIEITSKEQAQQLQVKMREESVTFSDLSFQTQLGFSQPTQQSNFEKNYEEFQNFLKDIGYSGPKIADLSQDEAKKLVADDGFFGVNKTADRLANFVLKGASDNEDLLRAGRSGLLEGMKQAEKIWGGDLPEISQKTMDKAIASIDKHMAELGYNIVDSQA